LDYELNDRLIEDIQALTKKFEKKKFELLRWIRWLSAVPVILVFGFLYFYSGYSIYFCLAGGILLAVFVGYLSGKLFEHYYTHQFYKKHIGNRTDIHNYKAYLTASKKYEQWFLRSKRKFWMSLKGLDFDREVVKLLRRAGYKVTRKDVEDRYGYEIVVSGKTLLFCEELSKPPLDLKSLLKYYKQLQFSEYKRAIVINRKGFTRDCYKSVKLKPVELWDLPKLIELEKKLES